MRLWVIAGTTEARMFCEMVQAVKDVELYVTLLHEPLVRYPVPVVVRQVTSVREFDGCIDVEGVCVDLIADFSHPHAIGIRRLLENVDEEKVIAYQRKEVVKRGDRLVGSYVEMAKWLKRMGVGNLLAFLGAKGGRELLRSMMVVGYRAKVYLRSIRKVEGTVHIPFVIDTFENVEDLVVSLRPDAVVFKDSGVEGGTMEKVSVCERYDVPYVALSMPKKFGKNVFFSVDEIVEFLLRRLIK